MFLALVGATGTGKTAVSLALARLLGNGAGGVGGAGSSFASAEIVCGDSRQLFRGLDAGTGKPTAAERGSVPHHLFDELDASDHPSAGWYARRAASLLEQIVRAGRTPLVVGGTGLYLKALYRGLAPIPEISPDIRAAIRQSLVTLGSETLHTELASVDPEAAARLAPRDRQRVARALEVVRGTGRPLSSWLRERPVAPLGGPERWRIVALHLARRALYRRLDERTRGFFAGDLLTETRSLLDQGVSRQSPGLASLGYAQAAAHLLDDLPLEHTIELAQRATRRYAKRQETWWRHEGPRAGLMWLSIGENESSESVARRALTLLREDHSLSGERPSAS
ncbi:MAG TPA: tRNA (adenosine(37)-N6)-dimethylallyltransferase MiaA [Candidatus Eisenbacteria bacterium]|nr:tRNA (adenosine(37)-N6)-dimethylallyltransferase MiaA [Candidatus Eisenbacteria bacterium]